jgi:hypothetical protein
MKIKLLLVGILAAAGAVGVAEQAGFPKMRFTAHVVGEDGAPVPDASATFIFNAAPVGAEQTTEVQEITDGNGNFTAEGYSQTGVLNWRKSLIKDGYYESTLPITPFYTSKDGEWQPWDQTYTTVMRKIGNRIPLYVKKTYSEIPAIDQPSGYDLEVGDWVAPYGKGVVSDFIMTLKRQHLDDNNYDDTVTFTFSNPGDGIQETTLPKEFSNSLFQWPREAPETGYQPNLTLHIWSDSAGMHGDRGDAVTNKKYFFRVRTEKQGDQIVSALYGKINEGFRLAPNSPKTCGISISYYLNPTSLDRNLEFSGDSLFKNLPQSETTHVP